MSSNHRASFFAAMCIIASCYGESAVRYSGTVTVADATPGHSFEQEANPHHGQAVPNAEVIVCTMKGCSDDGNGHGVGTAVNPDGTYGPLEIMVAGCTSSAVEVKASAPGYESVTYKTEFGKTDDPTWGEAYLNFRLQPLPAK